MGIQSHMEFHSLKIITPGRLGFQLKRLSSKYTSVVLRNGKEFMKTSDAVFALLQGR